jgi:hypothetical protein
VRARICQASGRRRVVVHGDPLTGAEVIMKARDDHDQNGSKRLRLRPTAHNVPGRLEQTLTTFRSARRVLQICSSCAMIEPNQ